MRATYFFTQNRRCLLFDAFVIGRRPLSWRFVFPIWLNFVNDEKHICLPDLVWHFPICWSEPRVEIAQVRARRHWWSVLTLPAPLSIRGLVTSVGNNIHSWAIKNAIVSRLHQPSPINRWVVSEAVPTESPPPNTLNYHAFYRVLACLCGEAMLLSHSRDWGSLSLIDTSGNDYLTY